MVIQPTEIQFFIKINTTLNIVFSSARKISFLSLFIPHALCKQYQSNIFLLFVNPETDFLHASKTYLIWRYDSKTKSVTTFGSSRYSCVEHCAQYMLYLKHMSFEFSLRSTFHVTVTWWCD
jgi:hypothetical protein